MTTTIRDEESAATSADHGSPNVPVDNGPTDADAGTTVRRRQVKITLSGRLIDALYRLRDHYELGSLAATVTRATSVLKTFTELEEAGGTIICRYPDGTEQLIKLDI